jgi:hypothetical protein
MKTAGDAKDAEKQEAKDIPRLFPWLPPRPLCPPWFSLVSGLLCVALLGVSLAQSAGWLTIGRDRLCVTEGAIETAANHRLSVNVPKMRAYVTEWTAQSAEVRFTYLGGTSKESALGSGAIRRQFGLKLRAQDPCNLVYAIWRIDSKSTPPESKLVVSVKRNPGAHTSAECGNRGYVDIRPRTASALPRLEPGQSHTLRAEMKDAELRVFADNHQVWEGDVGPDAAKLEGPVGIRSDNAHLEFEFLARESKGPHPDYVKACKSGSGDE